MKSKFNQGRDSKQKKEVHTSKRGLKLPEYPGQNQNAGQN